MKLLTKEIEKKLPPLYAKEDTEDPMVTVKFFQPWGSWTWFVIEGNARLADGKEVPLAEVNGREIEDVLFFGYVVGLEHELGYFSLSELESVRGPAGLKIERDRYWKPRPLSEIKKGMEKR